MQNDRPLFFITLALICVWVILDNIFGDRHLQKFLSNMFDFVEPPLKVGDVDEEGREVIDIQEGISDKTLKKDKDGNILYECPWCDYSTTDSLTYLKHAKEKHDNQGGAK